MPKVSVIVPVYQAEKFIGRCIESICNQTFEDIELILIDDGSKDNSYMCCLEYASKDARIKVLHQENKGVSATRNKGIRESKGKYILFVDSDDYIEQDMVEEMYMNAETTGAKVVICGYDYVYKKKIETQMPIGKEGVYNKLFITTNFWEFYRRGIIHNIGNKLYAKELLDKNEIKFDESRTILEDIQFCLELIEKTDLIYICQKKFYKYIMQENQNSIQKSYRKNYYRNLEEFFVYVESLGIEKSKEFYLVYMDALLLSLRNELYKINKKHAKIINEYKNICHLKYVKESEEKINIKDVGILKYIFYMSIWREKVEILLTLIFMWHIWLTVKMKGHD